MRPIFKSTKILHWNYLESYQYRKKHSWSFTNITYLVSCGIEIVWAIFSSFRKKKAYESYYGTLSKENFLIHKLIDTVWEIW